MTGLKIIKKCSFVVAEDFFFPGSKFPKRNKNFHFWPSIKRAPRLKKHLGKARNKLSLFSKQYLHFVKPYTRDSQSTLGFLSSK